MSVKKAIVAGYLCLAIDSECITPTKEDPLQVKKSFEIGQAALSTGGSIFNVALMMQKLGVSVSLIGKIGDDLFGDTLKKIIKQKDPLIADDLIVDPGVPTGYEIHLGSRCYYFPGANKSFYASDLHRDVLRDADLFHFSGPALMRSIYRGDGAELVSILQRARREGLSTSLDFGLPEVRRDAGKVNWQAVLPNALPLVDVFVTDIAQLLFLLKPETYQGMSLEGGKIEMDALTPSLINQLSEIVLDYGVKILLIDLGTHGFYLRTNDLKNWEKAGRGLAGLGEAWADRQLWSQAPGNEGQEKLTGQDGSAAGFLAGLLREADPRTALSLYAAASAHPLKRLEDPEKLPELEDLLVWVKDALNAKPLPFAESGFRKGDDGIWEK
jgi:sugar/nucleoside kinase (ribokinase family)